MLTGMLADRPPRLMFRSMSEDRKAQPDAEPLPPKVPETPKPKEIGGPKGPEPTRYGDWERNGRCIDF